MMIAFISRKDLKNTTSGIPKKVLQEIALFNQLGFKSFAIAETVNVEMVKEFNGIPIKTIKWPFSGYLRRWFYQHEFQRKVKRINPDIIIGHGDIVKQDVLFIHNCVHLAHELINGCPLPNNHEVGKVHKKILTQQDFKLLICNSKIMRDDLMKRFNINPQKVEVIYPEIDLKRFTVSHPESVRKEWRKKFSIPENHFVIGLVTSGNLKKRNLDLLIDAFTELNKEYPHLHLFVASSSISPRYKKIILKNVTFAPTILDVKNYYALIDIFCLPAKIEEFGRSVLEAMFCEKPVIASQWVGASEVLEGISRSLIMTSLTKEELINKIKMLLDKSFYEKVQELNKKTALKYSASEQNKKFKEALISHNILPHELMNKKEDIS